MKKILSLIFLTTLILIRPTITSAQVNVQDSLALVDLYNSTDGPHWKTAYFWLTTTPVKRWHGVGVDNNRVVLLDLSFNHLKGTLPSSFSNLNSLRNLYLETNQLSGVIPSSIGNLTLLNDLNLSSNQFTGSIPASLSKILLLSAELNLSNNQLSGSIPSSLDSLKYLTTLYLNNNLLSGNIPILTNIMALENLDLSYNQLSGSIPTFYGLNQLYKINVSYNQLTGSTLPQASNLTQLNVSHNHLSASNLGINNLPGEIRDLDLSYNNFNTGFPSLTFYIEILHIDHNQFTGSISTQIGNFTNLDTLTADNNQLSGSIPSDFGTLSNLRKLTLNDNQLTGGIPPSLGNLSTLTALALYNNKLTGSIPKELGRLDSLHYLYLSNNKLTGSIPDSLSNLKALYDIDLNSNQLTGSIPSSFGKLTQLRNLALNDNNLAGKIPSLLDSLKQLVSLKLQHNQLSGTVPSLNDLNLAQKISLRSNNFLFSGLERLTQKFGSKALYYDQASIPLHQHGSYLSVNAGGTLSNNTYTWYRYSDAFVSIKGDSSLQMILSGVYHVVVTNAVATGLTLYSDTIVYNNGLDKAVPASAITLYPNPSKSNATALFTATGKYSVQLTNLSGKTLQTKTGVATDGKNKADFDISTYPQGMYIITIKDEKESRMVKLTKE